MNLSMVGFSRLVRVGPSCSPAAAERVLLVLSLIVELVLSTVLLTIKFVSSKRSGIVVVVIRAARSSTYGRLWRAPRDYMTHEREALQRELTY